MDLILWKSFENLMDEFVQEGGLSLPASKELLQSPRSNQPEIRWRFPVAGGHYFGALAYWFLEEGEWRPYLLAEIILGSSPDVDQEAFLRWALEQNKLVVHPLKIALVGEDLFGISLRARVDQLDGRYWHFLLRSMLGYGRDIYRIASEKFHVSSYEAVFRRAA